ncbi:MAG: indolepyruvate oxidoreductase subunit beta [Clostridia bacterium]
MTNEVTSILLAGVGGQGTILVSKVLTLGLIRAGYDVKMSEIHGMAQRGGSVSTQVRYGRKVCSPIIGGGEADVLVAFEKMEAVRYARYLKPSGAVVINEYEIMPMTVANGSASYPEGTIEAMRKAFPGAGRCVTLPAAAIATELGSPRCMNIVLFGALVQMLGLNGIDWNEILSEILPEKVLELNRKAFRAGQEACNG